MSSTTTNPTQNKLSGVFYRVLMFSALASFSLNVHAGAFVHLFEWSWQDVAQECETVLGPKGFAAVQVSPPQEHIAGSQWWTRYQPTGYNLNSRSGNRQEFVDMVNRCQAAGVDVYVDAVVNHMAAGNRYYPDIPYYEEHFHTCFTDINYGDRNSIQTCGLQGLNDLNTGHGHVQDRIAAYLNDLVSIGVKGFRIDAAKHISADHVAGILSKVNGNPYIFLEVIGADGEPVKPAEYTHLGQVTEFNFEKTIAYFFRDGGRLNGLRPLKDWSGWLNSNDAVTFVANHDDQRQHPEYTLTYKDEYGLYNLAHIFMLAYPYGYPKVMSSYRFDNHDQGPPNNGPHTGDSCEAGWVCEHRWRGTANMVAFRNATDSAWSVNNWWDNGGNQIAFGRGDRGFVVINREGGTMAQTLQTGMAAGEYCDVIQGDFTNGQCSGPTIIVNTDGTAAFSVAGMDAAAIHAEAKVCTTNCSEQPVTTPPVVVTPPVDTGSEPLWNIAYFRGTPNGWSTTPMTWDNGQWTTTQVFADGDSAGPARFKITPATDWNESYPDQDYVVLEGAGEYRIYFNDQTKAITIEKIYEVEPANPVEQTPPGTTPEPEVEEPVTVTPEPPVNTEEPEVPPVVDMPAAATYHIQTAGSDWQARPMSQIGAQWEAVAVVSSVDGAEPVFLISTRTEGEYSMVTSHRVAVFGIYHILYNPTTGGVNTVLLEALENGEESAESPTNENNSEPANSPITDTLESGELSAGAMHMSWLLVLFGFQLLVRRRKQN